MDFQRLTSVVPLLLIDDKEMLSVVPRRGAEGHDPGSPEGGHSTVRSTFSVSDRPDSYLLPPASGCLSPPLSTGSSSEIPGVLQDTPHEREAEPLSLAMKAEHPLTHELQDVDVPDDFEIRESYVYPGVGVWSRIHLPQGHKVGPFKGVLKSAVEDASCAWEVGTRIYTLTLFSLNAFS